MEPSTGSANKADFIAEIVLLSVTLETLFLTTASQWCQSRMVSAA